MPDREQFIPFQRKDELVTTLSATRRSMSVGQAQSLSAIYGKTPLLR